MDANKIVVGCATVSYVYLIPTIKRPRGDIKGIIVNVHVDKEHRHHGLAKRMMNLLIENAETRGASQIILEATQDGRYLYEKIGFKGSDDTMYLNLDR